MIVMLEAWTGWKHEQVETSMHKPLFITWHGYLEEHQRYKGNSKVTIQM